jgi:hypothetical protein
MGIAVSLYAPNEDLFSDHNVLLMNIFFTVHDNSKMSSRRKRADRPLYPTDRWKNEIQQLYEDQPQLGITILQEDCYFCRFKCRGVVYSVLWHERHPLDPPLMYREEPDDSVTLVTPDIDHYSPASTILSLIADIVYGQSE